MTWEDGYDVLSASGGAQLRDVPNWTGPGASDVLVAAGLSQYATASVTLGGDSGYPGLGKLPAPGTAYPALGFDPAPGDPGEITRLVATLGSAASKLRAAHELIQRMADDQTSWQGDAAEAFHQKLKQDLPKYLDEGHQSLQKAADDLRGWGTRLDGYRTKAEAHEADAASARSTYGSAWTDAVSVAQSHRDDLALQGQQFSTDAELQAAQSRLNGAYASIEDAVKRVSGAFSTLRQAISDAKSLADTHSEDAAQVAKQLRSAAKDFAPHKPNPILNWIKEHGGDILSALAAVCGVIALFCPAFALAAILLSAGALALHAWKFASDGGQLLPLGKNWGNWVTLGGDLLGAVPGIGVTAKAFSLARDAGEAGQAVGAIAKAGAFARGLSTTAKEAAGGEAGVNGLLQSGVSRLVDGAGAAGQASDAAKFAGKLVQFHINATGAAFALAGFDPSAGNDNSFSNTNNSLGLGTGVLGGADLLTQAIKRLR